VAKAVKSVAAPVIKAIQKNGPTIGAVVGGIVGGAVGLLTANPAGVVAMAKAGAAIGRKVGIAAQFVANSCFPNPPKLDCNLKSTIQAAVVAGVAVKSTLIQKLTVKR
jgi:hypothetical protein